MSYRSVVLAVCLTVCLISAADAQELEPAGTLKVVDANGKLVGKIAGYQRPHDFPEMVAVGLRIDKDAFLLSVDRRGFIGNIETIYFESDDYSGTAFLCCSGTPAF
jgi:hypothetical protein